MIKVAHSMTLRIESRHCVCDYWQCLILFASANSNGGKKSDGGGAYSEGSRW